MEEKILVDSKEVELEEVKGKTKRIKEKIKKWWKKLDKKRLIFLTLFFLFLYFISEFLNGNDVLFKRIFGFSSTWNERVESFKNAWSDFFKFPKFWANYFLFVFVYWIIYGLTNRTKLSLGFITVFTFVFGVVNYIVTETRGISVTISDIYSIRTAMNVASGIKPTIEGNFIVGTVLFITLLIVLWKIKINEKKEARTTRAKIAGIILGVVGILVLFGPNYVTDTVELWNINRAYANSGMGLTIVRMAKDIKVSKPKNYNPDIVVHILNEYEDDTIDYGAEEAPNILIVMNESFSDLQKCYEIELSADPIETYHSLLERENVISGMMHSSQFGGGTANIEWELLTQNVTAFLPSGSMPYQQYITSEVRPTTVSYMNDLNYTTHGMHSWDKSGYSREKIYSKFLNFDHSKFFDTMTKLDWGYREYPTDWSFYEEYYEIMRNKEKGEKNFSFLVTMENHMPYYRVDPDGITFTSTDSELNSYLQLEYGSDRGLGLLLDFIDSYEENIIMLFFGDHQPNIGQVEKYKTTGIYNEEESNHTVPFFIYANYDIEEKSGIETSPNYLQGILLEAAGMPFDSYTKYVQELREEIPVITNLYYKDKEGNTYKINDTESPYYDKLQEYWKIIYYNMFDK